MTLLSGQLPSFCKHYLKVIFFKCPKNSRLHEFAMVFEELFPILNSPKTLVIQDFPTCRACSAAIINVYDFMEHDFLRYFDIVVWRTPPGQPWCNGICERFHRSLKSEVLNRVVPLDVAGIRRLSICYQEYFNGRRPHQGINGKTPTKVIQLESRQTLIPAIRYSKTPEVDGLITSFKLAA